MKLVDLALSRPRDHGMPLQTWSLERLIAAAVHKGIVESIGEERLRDVIHEEDVRCQAVKTWKRSMDPHFDQKVRRPQELTSREHNPHDSPIPLGGRAESPLLLPLDRGRDRLQRRFGATSGLARGNVRDWHPPGLHSVTLTMDLCIGRHRAMEGGGPRLRTLGAFSAVILLYAANFVAIRLVVSGAAPAWGAFLRFAPGAGFLGLIAAIHGLGWPRGTQLWAAAIYGTLSFGVSPALIYWALGSIGAGIGSVLLATVPIFALVFASLIGQETFRWDGAGGALLAILGVGVISYGSPQSAGTPAALVAAIAAAAFAGLAFVLLKREPPMDPVAVNGIGMAFGAVTLLGAALVFDEPLTIPSAPPIDVALAFLVASTVAGTTLLVYVLNRWRASSTAYQAVLSPPAAVILAAAVLGEPVTWTLGLGGTLVLAGVLVRSRSPVKEVDSRATKVGGS